MLDNLPHLPMSILGEACRFGRKNKIGGAAARDKEGGAVVMLSGYFPLP